MQTNRRRILILTSLIRVKDFCDHRKWSLCATSRSSILNPRYGIPSVLFSIVRTQKTLFNSFPFDSLQRQPPTHPNFIFASLQNNTTSKRYRRFIYSNKSASDTRQTTNGEHCNMKLHHPSALVCICIHATLHFKRRT